MLGTSAVLDPHPREIHDEMGQSGAVGIVGILRGVVVGVGS